MTVDECYGFWRYTTRIYCLYRLLKDEEEGRETAAVWFTVLKDYSKEEVYEAFLKAKTEFTNVMPGIPVILDYIRIKREADRRKEEQRKQDEELRLEEERRKDPEYLAQQQANLEKLHQMMKEWSDSVRPSYLKEN